LTPSTQAAAKLPDNQAFGITLTILVAGEAVFSTELNRPLELGRQRMDEASPYTQIGMGNRDRVVIAELSESTISRRHISLEPLSADRVRVTNLSSVNTVWIDSSKPLATESHCELKLPVFLTLANVDRAIFLYPTPDEDEGLQSLAQPTALPGRDYPAELQSLDDVLKSESAPGKSLIFWLRNTMEVFQSAATSPDFLAKAAKAVIDIVGLDHAAVLGWQDGQWQMKAVCHGEGVAPSEFWEPSRSLLERVRKARRTFWKVPQNEPSFRDHDSFMNLEAYVASPILDSVGETVGALYGERRPGKSSCRVTPISELEAMLVELLSCSVAAGNARMKQEQAALQARVLFEQFFTPELSRQLESDPALLSGRDCDVTVLFADIRGFSRISEKIGAAMTFDWINAVMGTLSECVIRHNGVLVDYIGDELVAMWGAPEECPDHAAHACRAAIAMLEELPALSDEWISVLEGPTCLGIGVNTGLARVGNTGSKRKFKYGPLGNTVNLASRIQGATKFVRAPLVVTGATAEQIGAQFPTRRLCSVEVVNIAEPVELFELRPTADATWPDLRQRYETALQAFEQQDFHAAARILGNLLTSYPDDGPTVILLSRAVDMLARPPKDFSPVWKLSEK